MIGFFSILLLFQVNSIYGLEEIPIITIDFLSGNVIDLDKTPQMIRANIEIQNYDPQHGYHFMEISRLSDGDIIKSTEILPKVIDDDLYGVQILHYLDPDDDETNVVGDYGLRIFSESGPTSISSTFSIIQSSKPVIVTQNIEESQPEVETEVESLQIETSEQSKIPAWVHDIFVWYADETISENDLLSAIQYLISEEIIDVD
ncbi:hypothetical protein C5F49_08145 [Nitrosopumilus oxyclinae]|uniref:Peptidase n=1 Tax=Nitrosopumilus oxyclinae TaxID=1959104 RepID=A0A7D5M2W2_9ARCH|nr:hypothetical protein [Nitrosopumilus oxyclinae]QLH05292.1 hypothetical protein C5F49_08145 [Nitrosopumilus oxyclinae]